MIERCVVVQRQTDGFGLTVTGDHPVYVHTVKPDGAAYCAGVRQGDRILKVNGMPVTSSNHLEVVRMISGGQNVALTLLGKPPDPLPQLPVLNYKLEQKFRTSDPMLEANGKDDWRRKRNDLLGQMLDDEQKHVEGLRGSSENGEKLDRALKRIVSLQSQLKHIRPTSSVVTEKIPMDIDTDEEENEMYLPGSQGPFSNLAELKTHPAHLAVFINYLLTSANPSSLIICMTAEHIAESDADTLKRVFVPGRQRAVTDINVHLNEFRQKRPIQTGQMFDEANQLSHLVRGDVAMEQRVGERMFFRTLESYSGSVDFDTADIKTQSTISSLATVIKITLGKASTISNEKLMEKFPQFIARDKPGKLKKPPSGIKAKIQVKGHTFAINSVNTVHYCYQCRDAIWGMQPWIYFCNNCDVKVHPQCTSSLTDACYPVTQSKQKNSKSRLSGLIGRSDAEEDEATSTRAPGEPNVKSTSSDSGIGQEIHDRSVNRSHSMRNRVSTIPQSASDDRVAVNHRRDRSSTPSWQSGATTRGLNDLTPADEADECDRRFRGIDSRSKEGSSRLAIDLQSVSASSSCSHTSIPIDEELQMKRPIQFVALVDNDDSDLEIETEAPPLEQLVGWEVIRHLKPKEKKRQEVINELFHTERTHVRNLKILFYVFCKPMLMNNIVQLDVVRLLFANLEELLAIHQKMCNTMREAVEKWRLDSNQNGLYGDIGGLMEGMFQGEAGEHLKNVTSIFCQHQQHALETLRARCKRDKEDSLVRFLAEAEANPLCRKLQMKDMIPVEMQRLVKYPLLLETIAKYTSEPSEEQEKLLQTVHSAKKILSAVNTAKRNAENFRRLEDLQKRIDTTPYDKEFSGHDYAALNLTKYRLVHDGPLTCRFHRGKMVELYAVLLEKMLVLLTKHSDGNKLQLKSLEPSKEAKWTPILQLSTLIAKEKANDKRAFFLVLNNQNGAQIYELWLKLMSDQIENEKKQQTINIEPSFEVGAQTSSDSDGMAKVQVVTHPRLVNANEITVQQPTILEHAQPVLTPSETLKRSDDIIFQALLTKQKILAQHLPGSDKKAKAEELEKLTELLGGLAVSDLKQRDGKELAMSAIVHGNRLLDSINQSLYARKEYDEEAPGGDVLVLENQEPNVPSVPCYKLTAIAAPLMNHLKAVMQVIQDQQNELNVVRQQLYHYKKLASDVETHDRSVSEETLTDMGEQGERKIVTKRQRAPSIQPMT
ncbi:unnamed protein product [Caenorhabditis auriculariae]|uniref:Uncharacterized protein n=1 Tax=Caenorhabditis auriculariae TaxID=2777116 RepID=A0A8S1GZV7_9PELO|nr:unnamed protein product [Caenorhabditis auriculariae]